VIEFDDMGNEIIEIDSLLPKLLLYGPAIPYTAAVDMLRTKYQEFAMRTGSVRMTLEIAMQADVPDYPIPIPAGHVLQSVREIRFGHLGGYLRVADHWRGFHNYFGHRYSIDDRDYLVFHPAPKRDTWHKVHVRVLLVPRDDCDMMPVKIQTMYGQAIAAGAAGEAMNARGKPWYDPGNSVRLMRLFYQGINDARANAERDKMGTTYMKTRRFI